MARRSKFTVQQEIGLLLPSLRREDTGARIANVAGTHRVGAICRIILHTGVSRAPRRGYGFHGELQGQ